MTNKNEIYEVDDVVSESAARIAYIKPTGVAEAQRLGIMPAGIKLPDHRRDRAGIHRLLRYRLRRGHSE
jgi:hypothetical protein